MKLWVLEILCTVLTGHFFIESAAQNCEEDGAVAEMFCPDSSFLLKAIGSRSPFFGDALAVSCVNAREQLHEDEEHPHTFLSADGGSTLDAGCPDESEIITRISICIMNDHVQTATISCSKLKDPERIEERFQATSEEMKNTLVDCGENSAVQSISLEDAGNGMTTKITFGCLKISLPENEPPELK
ncbi:uncharacterized protein LOC129984046 [Argiope bruennichi]|uniref:Uncharacterized protein n=1 Tax=Argiope bruennichi TaxID=94029 RepID=A0A8T0EGH3_ARGBR|nr:uncharacterized protein LOC129984046 [Argiope bruennichi]KAF8772987.1 hypothetical protein HNY73_015691 [Argiope bruennichi]